MNLHNDHYFTAYKQARFDQFVDEGSTPQIAAVKAGLCAATLKVAGEELLAGNLNLQDVYGDISHNSEMVKLADLYLSPFMAIATEQLLEGDK